MSDRRDFIHKCAAVGATLLASGSVLGADGAVPGLVLAPRLSKASFQPLLHQAFRCFTGRGHALRLELTEVRDGPMVPGLEQFDLVLRDTDGAAPLPPDLYRLYHPGMGTVLMHLAPADSLPRGYVTHFGLFA